MTEGAKTARREYKRKWNAANKDKVNAAQVRYWERKAAEIEKRSGASESKGEIV